MSEVFAGILNLESNEECNFFDYRIIDFRKLNIAKPYYSKITHNWERPSEYDKYYIMALKPTLYYEDEHYEKYYVSKECYDAIIKYFKMRDGKLICKYNDKLYKGIDLTYCIYEDKQFLHLKLESKTSSSSDHDLRFDFYINGYKELSSKLYEFDTVLFLNKNTILGYNFEDYNYYNISDYKDIILKHIDEDTLEIINNANDSDQLNLYTRLINKIGNKDNYITRKCELLINNIPIDSNIITHNQCLILNNKINKFDISKLSLAKDI